MNNLITNLMAAYAELNTHNIDRLEPLYDDNVVFQDPASRISGRTEMLDHFRSAYENVTYCTFNFDLRQCDVQDTRAYLVWQMDYAHKKLNGGDRALVDGISLLEYGHQITLHRDWFDLGQMVYENLPAMGRLIQVLKNKISAH
ncbi:MAG: nuclear transport factor 2 family protein [Pseudomonadota bacterium]